MVLQEASCEINIIKKMIEDAVDMWIRFATGRFF